MSKVIGGVVAAVVGMLVSYGITSMGTVSKDEMVEMACESINKTSPQMIDDVTRLDGAAPMPGGFRYLYTIIGLPSLTLTQMTSIESATRSHVVATSEMNVFRENAINIGYLYNNEDGDTILEFTIENE